MDTPPQAVSTMKTRAADTRPAHWHELDRLDELVRVDVCKPAAGDSSRQDGSGFHSTAPAANSHRRKDRAASSSSDPKGGHFR